MILRMNHIARAVIVPVVILTLCLALLCSQSYQVVSIKCIYLMMS